MRVPKATPSTFMWKHITKQRLLTMFTMFCRIAMSMGRRVFCMPINQPDRAYSPKTAGAPHTQMWK